MGSRAVKLEATDADENPITIAMVAGEPSGDRQGAALLHALRERAAPRLVNAWGIGGPAMRAAGVAIRHDSTARGSIGIANAAANLPYLLRSMADMKRTLAAAPPDALVAIDAGAFNVPLAQYAKTKRLCPVFYYFPPGSWRRSGRPGRHRKLAQAADMIVTPFPWSEGFLRQDGANAQFVGHPLLDLVAPRLPDADFYDEYGLDPLRPLVALLPGSRSSEVAHILPAMIGAAGEISHRIPGVQFAVALPNEFLRSQVEEIIRREQRTGGRAARLNLFLHQAGDKLASLAQSKLTPPLLATNEGLTVQAPPADELSAHGAHAKGGMAPLVICSDVTYDVLARSDLVITKSGTSTLEAAILNKPMIIVYRGSRLMAAEWAVRKKFLNITHMGLPNILAGERLVPELIQDDATPERISELAVEMLLQPDRLLVLKQKIADVVRNTLGERGGVGRAADLLYSLLKSK